MSIGGGENVGHCDNESSHKHVSISRYYRTELFESPDRTVLDFYSCGWTNSEVYKTKLDRPDELLASILVAAAYI